jgi:hypothetical protein
MSETKSHLKNIFKRFEFRFKLLLLDIKPSKDRTQNTTSDF